MGHPWGTSHNWIIFHFGKFFHIWTTYPMAGKSIGKKLNSSATMNLGMVVSGVAMFIVVK
jgi:threonine/homoserine efflux transporter RhtA